LVFLWRLTSLACLACVAAIAATSAGAAPPVLTASQYRQQANAICSDFNAFRFPAEGTFAERLGALLDKGRTTLTALRKLRPPSSLAPVHAQILVTDARRIDFLTSLTAQLKAGRLTISQLAARVAKSPLAAQANALWKQVGALGCVQY
jgi:hypothetical protein